MRPRWHAGRVRWHPHLHVLVTNSGFRPDGTFVSWPTHDTARLTEAFRRAVLRLFVRLELFDGDQAAGMLTWPHSGFHVHTAVWIPEDDRAFATRLARYCGRNPVALERLTYDRAATTVTYRSDKSEGPTAGTETADPLKFLARVLTHIPDKGQVTTRYYGWYANRRRGMRRRAAPATADAPVPMAVVVAPTLAPTEATRRWAALLRQIFEVDPLACPKCHGTMRVLAFITQTSVIDQILTPLRTRAASGARPGARSPPSTAVSVVRGTRRLRLLHVAPRAPAYRSRPRGVPVPPESSLRRATTTHNGDARTTRDAGGRATDPTWTARALAARREASRYTSVTPIEFPTICNGRAIRSWTLVLVALAQEFHAGAN